MRSAQRWVLAISMSAELDENRAPGHAAKCLQEVRPYQFDAVQSPGKVLQDSNRNEQASSAPDQPAAGDEFASAQPRVVSRSSPVGLLYDQLSPYLESVTLRCTTTLAPYEVCPSSSDLTYIAKIRRSSSKVPFTLASWVCAR